MGKYATYRAGMKRHIEKVKKVIALAADSAIAAPDAAKSAAADLPWMKYVAMLTGALAALAGFLTVRTTTLTNEAIYESNQAILSQTQASDTWAEYQANSIKARVVEMQLIPSSPIAAADRAELAKANEELRHRQPELKQLAEAREKARNDHLAEGTKRLGEKDVLNYAGMAAQLAIALASVAALTRKRILLDIGAGVGVMAIGLTAYTFVADYLAGR